jgi:hypothetical protein
VCVVCTSACAYMTVCMCACDLMSTCVGKYDFVRTWVCMCMYFLVQMYASQCVCMHLHMCCLCACEYMCVCVSLCVLCVGVHVWCWESNLGPHPSIDKYYTTELHPSTLMLCFNHETQLPKTGAYVCIEM